MALNCPDCGQKAALVRVGIFVDPYNISIEQISLQVSELIDMTPMDFPDEAEVVCQACGAEVPYRLAQVATHRADAHQHDKARAESLHHEMEAVRHFWSRAIDPNAEGHEEAREALERILNSPEEE